MSEGGSRKRKHDAALGKRRNVDWWGPDEAEESEDDDEDAELVDQPQWNVQHPTLPRLRVTSPPHEMRPPQHKRRHVEGEIGRPLHEMSLNEPVCTVEEPDTDMTTGSSYEISPNRVYVHSLDDSEEEVEPEESYVYYDINPYVAERLSKASGPRKETVPKWLASAQDKSFVEDASQAQALVPWRPPAWQQVQETEEHAAPTDERRDEDMMEL
ncbi:hypothetical protein GLX27_003509 [Malassezia furfur]|uniref:Uncharacterized protein n=1 Tax=Malassezia furfur TaxID=55194 RepID=A0ABY8ETB2_MALFU|nr:hypothetical protein CBS14141_003145 [Malassezia furfur]WFD48838.1 hypothetical protein GLX27_003509 [Malassezia furfur]